MVSLTARMTTTTSTSLMNGYHILKLNGKTVAEGAVSGSGTHNTDYVFTATKAEQIDIEGFFSQDGIFLNSVIHQTSLRDSGGILKSTSNTHFYPDNVMSNERHRLRYIFSSLPKGQATYLEELHKLDNFTKAQYIPDVDKVPF